MLSKPLAMSLPASDGGPVTNRSDIVLSRQPEEGELRLLDCSVLAFQSAPAGNVCETSRWISVNSRRAVS